jgi:hypothetical protein
MVLNEFFSGAIVDDYRVSQVITWEKNQVFTCSKTRMTVGNLIEEALRPSFEVGWAEMPRASVYGKEAMRKEKVFAEMRSDDEKLN